MPKHPQDALKQGEAAYGITTGFGALRNVTLPHDRLACRRARGLREDTVRALIQKPLRSGQGP